MSRFYVSFIVPIYNIEAYLPACLASFVGAESLPYEVILVDDGSTDGCSALASTFQREDPTRRRLITQKNTGLGAARNAGFSLATGEYVFFVDGDDTVDVARALEIATWAKESRLDVAAGLYSSFSCDASGVVKSRASPLFPSPVPKSVSGADLLSYFLQKKIYMSAVWRYAWRRDFLIRLQEDGGSLFIENLLHEDLPFTYNALLKAESAGSINLCFYQYLTHRAGSITSATLSDRRLADSAKILPLMEQTLLASPFSHDKYIQSHLAGIAFELWNRILSEEFSLGRNHRRFFRDAGLFRFIFNYSATAKYRLAALLLKISPAGYGFLRRVSRCCATLAL